MSNYLAEQILIFRDTIHKNLIGPGSDIIISDIEEEIISDYPLSRYFSGILFPERESVAKQETIGSEDRFNAESGFEDSGENEENNENSNDKNSDDEAVEEIFSKSAEEVEKEYSEANQYFPTNFGLTFCVPISTETIDVTFSYAKYKQLKPEEGKIEIKKEDFLHEFK